MNRSNIEQQYDVKSGRIVSPGKFEGEPVFAPHFWFIAMCGFADSDDGDTFTFHIKKDDEEHKEFPELKEWMGRKRALRLRQDDQGFVHCY